MIEGGEDPLVGISRTLHREEGKKKAASREKGKNSDWWE